MSRIVVEPSELDTLARELISTHMSFDERMVHLNSVVRGIDESWTGSASTKFEELYSLWLHQFQVVSEHLSVMGVALRTVADNHRAATAANLRMWD
ncbi:MAG: WXG100 family type VII secretion target [Ferrimicrobium sp.]